MIDLLFGIILGLLLIGLISSFLMFWRLPVPVSRSNNSHLFSYLSIIVPAYNEEKRIRPLLDSLVKQSHPMLEVIIVNDGSTDRTADIAREYGFQVISRDNDNTDWTGKSAACWTGAKAATGSQLLFLDADTELVDRNSLKRLVNTYVNKGERGILSLQPYHMVGKPYESLSLIFNIIVMVGMNVFTIFGRRWKTAGSFGPCILTNREDYFQSGGHELVCDAIMDDFVLGDAYRENGLPVHCYGGRGLVNFRMYPEGFPQLLEGWTKNFGTASKSTNGFVMLLINLWIAAGFMPLVLIAGGLIFGAGIWIWAGAAAYLAYAIQLYWHARRVGNFPLWSVLIYPLHLVFFTGVFLRSLYLTNVKHTVTWRGRKMNV